MRNQHNETKRRHRQRDQLKMLLVELEDVMVRDGDIEPSDRLIVGRKLRRLLQRLAKTDTLSMSA